MDALNTQSNWLAYKELKHWIKHGFIPVALILIVLWMPKPWSIEPASFNPTLQLELTAPPIEKQVDPPPTERMIEPKVIQPKEAQETEPPAPAPKPPLQAQPQEVPVMTKPEPTPDVPPAAETPTLKATDVMRMLNNRKSMDITPEFKARTAPAKDFYIPKPEATDWYADVPYLDESVDKPRIQMKFYAEGIEGSIEKFFDKITVSKTFTTKYGTKIHCAWIGIIAACSWK